MHPAIYPGRPLGFTDGAAVSDETGFGVGLLLGCGTIVDGASESPGPLLEFGVALTYGNLVSVGVILSSGSKLGNG